MTPWLSRATRIAYALVILLVLATPVLLVWQHYGMTRTLEISPQHPYDAVVTDDRVMPRGNPAPGNSVASLAVTKDAYILRCQMGTAARYPNCAIQFRLGDPGKGIDMSGYDTVTLDVRYTGHGRHVLKLHLLNFEPEFDAPGQWDAQRFNEVLIDIPARSEVTIPMHALRTADWWHFARRIPLSKSYVRVDHVTTVELQADDASAAGHAITVEVRKIEFRGKWISRTTMLGWLMAAWTGCGMLGLSLGLLHFRAGLQASRTRLEQLAAIDRERKEAAAARETALREAVALARQRSQFLAQMSHELRTPLNAIIGYAQLLGRDRDGLTERQSSGLATIRESGQHLLTLINDILDLARVEAGRMVLHPAAVHLDTFLQVLANIMRVKAEEKGLAFSCELAPGLPSAVTVDETRLRQVLLNLLGNAVKFTDTGRVSLRMLPAAPSSAPDSARVRFEVADTGIGMGAQQLARIFQPFEQVATAQRREGGTGLGLAISQQLVHLMGGHIDVVSAPGKGSTFSFEIDVPVAAAAPAAAVAHETLLGYEGERKRLLVVDDVPQNRAMMLDLLQETGFIVAAASNGLECLVLLDSFKPDLILMDVMMPVMDGNETTRQIRHMPGWGDVPILAVTASASPDDERRSRDAGASAFLPKPVDHDVLLRTIGRLLALRWTTELPAPEGGEEAAMAVPPADEIETLWQLAQIGNMREIRARAAYLRGLDPAYGPFAHRLDTLAQGYHSKQLVAFVARFRSDSEKVLDDRSV
ncbi:ATP-binding protein [Telluria mixta]|uniref:histidine kinase n=1 Tax=Telluria mixta TaxID=34071 RepID=A0ABT2BYJ4_9BURK|nr:ATP-binding protein [Telluria mixta]MCS0630209.1 ATP-binding protein [Telluria mixta]WEM94482.1 ATP-binding protein [Telluria mixta]